MTETFSLSPEVKLRFDFFAAKTIRERILIKRKARAEGFETVARELEAAGYVPTDNS